MTNRSCVPSPIRPHGVYETTPKMEDSVRFIKMPMQTMNLLRMWKKQCDMLRITNLGFWNDTGYTRANGRTTIKRPSVAKQLAAFAASIGRASRRSAERAEKQNQEVR